MLSRTLWLLFGSLLVAAGGSTAEVHSFRGNALYVFIGLALFGCGAKICQIAANNDSYVGKRLWTGLTEIFKDTPSVTGISIGLTFLTLGSLILGWGIINEKILVTTLAGPAILLGYGIVHFLDHGSMV